MERESKGHTPGEIKWHSHHAMTAFDADVKVGPRERKGEKQGEDPLHMKGSVKHDGISRSRNRLRLERNSLC